MSDIGPQDRPVDLSGTTPTPNPSPPPPPPPSGGSGFDFNQPTIVSLLYLSSFLVGVTALVGVVLAYIWKNQPQAEWEVSHYRYHIRTFWLALIGSIISILLIIVVVGVFLWIAVGVLVVVRSVLSLINAQKREPMPNPETWLA